MLRTYGRCPHNGHIILHHIMHYSTINRNPAAGRALPATLTYKGRFCKPPQSADTRVYGRSLTPPQVKSFHAYRAHACMLFQSFQHVPISDMSASKISFRMFPCVHFKGENYLLLSAFSRKFNLQRCSSCLRCGCFVQKQKNTEDLQESRQE